ncbi:M14 family zinc carboxypeptidase [Methylotetracoccus oryzae]|uniref:M14 family zinc carboxypeptidase n=1 Tax=Methylotetracoccus oryzae TaxID=1919059 RepID=UPI001F239A96|nr:M14 family zinc carboxypeptidase [Methylotetracoccus oryzae]
MNAVPAVTSPLFRSPVAEAMREAMAGGMDFPEMRDLLDLTENLHGLARVDVLDTIAHRGRAFPLISVAFGPDDPRAPVLALFGGVHGLERIGTRIVLSYLRTLSELARWDRITREMLKTTRIVLFPLVNPVGMLLKRRSNGNGVDLMRNSPVRADGIGRWHLFAGHSISPRLPWYQGTAGAPMEAEAQAVCKLVREEIFPASIALVVDVHSGYGNRDRIWFPYARTRDPFPRVPEVLALKGLLDSTYPHHIYCVEPQSRQYVTHGDLWDYLYDDYHARGAPGHFIPFTLELGSWVWVRKNWWQLFDRLGAFNPHLPHREQRALRRHLHLFDFLYRAVQSPEPWAAMGDGSRERLMGHAVGLWYAK